jgi:hypothetical protein
VLDFTRYPTYSPYRTLRRTAPMMVGADVYALQTALTEMGFDTGGTDGIFGDKTLAAVNQAQAALSITVDGLAGGGTQQALTKRLANRARTLNDLPLGLVYGQCMRESSCRLGNYSAPRADGSYDAGVTQRNTAFTAPRDGFHVEKSIELLGRHLAAYHRLFAGTGDRRSWELAAGAWNAPAFACRMALQEGAAFTGKPSWWPTELVWVGPAKSVSDTSRAKLEEYMGDATALMA